MNSVSLVFALCMIASAYSRMIVPAVGPSEAIEFLMNGKQPFADMHKYLRCVPVVVDSLVPEHGCEDVWNVHRQNFLSSVNEYEYCTEFEDENDVDECYYEKFAQSERIVSMFYSDLKFKSSEMAYNVIARAVINDCQSDDMRFGGMEINN